MRRSRLAQGCWCGTRRDRSCSNEDASREARPRWRVADMFLRELRDLERQIRSQRSKVAPDQERVRRAVSEVPRQLLRKLGSREGLIVSFSVGAAAAAFAPGRGVMSVA